MGSFQVNAKCHGKGQGALHALKNFSLPRTKHCNERSGQIFIEWLRKKNHAVRGQWWPLFSGRQVFTTSKRNFHSFYFFFFLEMRQCVIFLKTLQCKASVKESGSSNTNYTSNQVMDLTPQVRLHLQARPGYSRQISQKPQPILWGPFTDIVHWIYISRHDD